MPTTTARRNRARRSSRPGGKFTASAREIYKAWALIRERHRRGDQPIPEQLDDRFGIQYWEWSRLKVIYEAATEGNDPVAKRLIAGIDSGDFTVSAAYTELQAHIDSKENPPSPVKLRELRSHVTGALAYAETLADNLTRGATLNTFGMSEADIEDVVKKLTRAGYFYRKAADALSRTRTDTTT